MSPAQVQDKLRGDHELVEVTQDQIIAIGVWDVTGEQRRKVFKFQNGQLYEVEYHALDEVPPD